MRLRSLDYAAAAVALAVIGFFVVYAHSATGESGSVRIQSESSEHLYAVEITDRIAVPGPLGDTIVEIQDGQVRVLDSPCRDKVCMHVGWVSRAGSWIACLPNRVFVRLDGGPPGDVDAQTF